VPQQLNILLFKLRFENSSIIMHEHVCILLGLIQICILPTNSAFHPSGVGKSSTGVLAGVKAGRVHLCRVSGNTV